MTLPALTLWRMTEFLHECVIGQLRDFRGAFKAHTLELPYRGDKPEVSSVPADTYAVLPYTSPHLGECFRLDPEKVAPRTQIEIHAGNLAADVRGCILLGGYCAVFKGHPAVLASRTTLAMMLREYPDGFTMRITDERLP